MTVTLRSGPADVLASGEVTTFFGHPLEAFVVLDEVVLRLVLRFAEDAERAGPRVDHAPLPDGHDYTLVNFDDATGRGSADPVLLGAVGDDLVFLHFRAFRFGRTPDHTVHYTLFRVPQSEVDWQDAEDP